MSSELRYKIIVSLGNQSAVEKALALARKEFCKTCLGAIKIADDTFSNNTTWIEQQWEVARLKQKQAAGNSFLLVIDEIQKIKQWSREVKNQCTKYRLPSCVKKRIIS